MKKNGVPVPAPPAHADADRFPYGWRYICQRGINGREVWDRVPLTLEDVLHPQEGDVVAENSQHEKERRYLTDVFQERLAGRSRARVFSDCIIDWGVPGLGNHSPDISVFDEIAEPQREWGTFPVAKQGARPILVIELVSPETRSTDVGPKVVEYHQAGVPLYVIVDQQREGGPRQLLSYRFMRKGYVRMRLDGQGRLLLKPLGLFLELQGNQLVCIDAVTGERLGDYTEERRARQEAESRVRELEEQLRRRRRRK